MSYTDRLREMTYTSPNGSEFTLQFDGLSRTGGKKAPVSEFPGQDQGAVQDLGETIGTFPITCYITGSDYDTAADLFWTALSETGPGQLAHPRWGNVNVLPTQRSQVEEFVEGVGRAVFTITFLKVNDEQFLYPTSTTDYGSETSAYFDDASSAITDGLDDEITDVGAIASGTNLIGDLLDDITSAFEELTDLSDDTLEDIAQAITDIEDDIGDLITAPADLLESLIDLLNYPTEETISITDKIDSYVSIYDSIIDSFISTATTYGETLGDVWVSILAALGISAAVATTEGTLTTTTDSAEAIDTLSDFVISLHSSIEDIETAGDFTADYETQLQSDLATTSALNGLIKDALSLPTEQTETLSRSITPIQFVYEKYGSLDMLEDIMDYNDFQGDEILIIPKGMTVRWYDD